MKQTKEVIVAWETVINFWFGKPNEEIYGQPRKCWFIKEREFDRQVQSRFLETYHQATKGKLISWQQQPLSCLALIIVLDQFPRNMFRNSSQAFATDSQALQLAKYAVNLRFDRQLLPVQRWFVYLPFEHSENLADQQTSVKLFETLQGDRNTQDTIDYAYRHLKIIERFGRFPHRNKILGRKSTLEEEDFLQQPGSQF